ncbi:MAG: peptidoglycan-binding protein [Bryobacteraceae bacterium]|nr:peptidoglycan-binding protein [Bryobacteraceae bacterium]
MIGIAHSFSLILLIGTTILFSFTDVLPRAEAAGKRTSSTASSRKSSSKQKKSVRAPSSRKKSAASARRSKNPTRSARRGPPVQQEPTRERYKEIQQALAEKGYFNGEPNGIWGPESVEAMRRFQEDQDLVANGKITALSLIYLGLGPKRDVPGQTKIEQQEP